MIDFIAVAVHPGPGHLRGAGRRRWLQLDPADRGDEAVARL